MEHDVRGDGNASPVDRDRQFPSSSSSHFRYCIFRRPGACFRRWNAVMENRKRVRSNTSNASVLPRSPARGDGPDRHHHVLLTELHSVPRALLLTHERTDARAAGVRRSAARARNRARSASSATPGASSTSASGRSWSRRGRRASPRLSNVPQHIVLILSPADTWML